MFINYMCEVDVGAANCDFIGYSTPSTRCAASCRRNWRTAPSRIPAPRCWPTPRPSRPLPEEINAAMDRAWSDMKSYDENGSGWVVPVFLVSAMGLAAFNIWRRLQSAGAKRCIEPRRKSMK